MIRNSIFAVCLLACFGLAACRDGKPGFFDRSGYHVRDGVVWFLPNWTSHAFVVQNADPATFVFPLPKGGDTDYARDAKRVFLAGRVIPDADAATFEIIDERFTRDARHVFLGRDVFCDDPQYFSRVSVNFVKDSQVVYDLNPKGGERIVSRDPANFRQISVDGSYSFCADTERVFVNGNLIPEAQPATFKILGGAYTRDASRSYYFNTPMPDGTDVSTLVPLAGGYAKDKSRVYYLGKILQGADAATFEITDPVWPKAKDKSHAYEQGHRAS